MLRGVQLGRQAAGGATGGWQMMQQMGGCGSTGWRSGIRTLSIGRPARLRRVWPATGAEAHTCWHRSWQTGWLDQPGHAGKRYQTVRWSSSVAEEHVGEQPVEASATVEPTVAPVVGTADGLRALGVHVPVAGEPEPAEGTTLVLTNEERAGILNALRPLYANEVAQQEANDNHCVNNQVWVRAVAQLRTLMMKYPHRYFLTSQEVKKFSDKGTRATTDPAELLDFCRQMLPLVVKVANEHFAADVAAEQEMRKCADLTLPHEWYLPARLMHRKIVYHAGPTNSGKTYTALSRLKQSQTGVYCGPLRLLALEVYETLNEAGVSTNLLTGQERRELPFASHTSCTVEMCSLDQVYDVAVLDEIQMIGDEDRGWAWTRALLGVQAKEIHLCGDASAADAIRVLIEQTGDSFEMREYTRRSVLHPLPESLNGDYSKVQSGDCIVAFSRKDIYAIRRTIEESTPFKCCVVYGQLPPETRSSQARLFNNEGTGWDVLVASDAVGMGLNLNIRRIIFHSLEKFNGDKVGPVPVSQVKQIAGRAGRFGSRYPQGYCTTLEEKDLSYMTQSVGAQLGKLPAVGLYPNVEQIEMFARSLQRVKLATLLDRFVAVSKLDGHYFLCRTRVMKDAANCIEHLHMSLADRFVFCSAPVNTRRGDVKDYFVMYAEQYASGKPVRVNLQLPLFVPRSNIDLEVLEGRHLALDMYLWLCQRFPNNFVDMELATELKTKAINMIEQCLVQMSASAQIKRRRDASQNTKSSRPPKHIRERQAEEHRAQRAAHLRKLEQVQAEVTRVHA